jgi:hypothetical protein
LEALADSSSTGTRETSPRYTLTALLPLLLLVPLAHAESVPLCGERRELRGGERTVQGARRPVKRRRRWRDKHEYED